MLSHIKELGRVNESVKLRKVNNKGNLEIQLKSDKL